MFDASCTVVPADFSCQEVPARWPTSFPVKSMTAQLWPWPFTVVAMGWVITPIASWLYIILVEAIVIFCQTNIGNVTVFVQRKRYNYILPKEV